MENYLLARDYAAMGIDHNELRQMTQRGDIRKLRRGAYCGTADRTVIDEHLLVTEASIALAESDSVVSFGSAAAIHGLPIPTRALERVHLTRNRNSSGRIRPGIHVHVAPLVPSEIDLITGVPVTNLARTFVDVARTVDFSNGVAAGDAALRRNMAPSAVLEQLESAKYRRGVRKARRVASIIDGRSESVGESISRVIMVENGLPTPELQVEFRGADGFQAITDFYWHEYGVIGEFDGQVKYGRLLRDGENPGDVVFREKRREDRLREMGAIVVRWVWDDLLHPERLIARINRALELARRIR